MSAAAEARLRRAVSPKHVRMIALMIANGTRAHQFSRVSKRFLDAVEVNTIRFIRERVKCNPSKGVTLE